MVAQIFKSPYISAVAQAHPFVANMPIIKLIIVLKAGSLFLGDNNSNKSQDSSRRSSSDRSTKSGKLVAAVWWRIPPLQAWFDTFDCDTSWPLYEICFIAMAQCKTVVSPVH